MYSHKVPVGAPSPAMLLRDLENMRAAYKEEVEKRLLAEQKVKQLNYREQTRSKQQKGDGGGAGLKGLQQLRNLKQLSLDDDAEKEPHMIEVPFDEGLMGRPLFQFNHEPESDGIPHSPRSSSNQSSFGIDLGYVLSPLMNKIVSNGKPIRTKAKVRLEKKGGAELPKSEPVQVSESAPQEREKLTDGSVVQDNESETEKAAALPAAPEKYDVEVLLPLSVEVALQDLTPIPNKPAKNAFPPSLTLIPPYGLCEVHVKVVVVNEKRREELRAKMEEEERAKLEAEKKRKEEEERRNRELEMMRAEDEASAFAYLDPVVIDVYPCLESITDEVDLNKVNEKGLFVTHLPTDSISRSRSSPSTSSSTGALDLLSPRSRKAAKKERKEEKAETRERALSQSYVPPVVLAPESSWHQVSQEEKLKKLLSLNGDLAIEDMPNYFGIVEKGSKEKMILAIKKEDSIEQSRGRIEIPLETRIKAQQRKSRDDIGGSMIVGMQARLPPLPKPAGGRKAPRKRVKKATDDLDKSDTEFEVTQSQNRRQLSQRSLEKYHDKIATERKNARKKRTRKLQASGSVELKEEPGSKGRKSSDEGSKRQTSTDTKKREGDTERKDKTIRGSQGQEAKKEKEETKHDKHKGDKESAGKEGHEGKKDHKDKKESKIEKKENGNEAAEHKGSKKERKKEEHTETTEVKGSKKEKKERKEEAVHEDKEGKKEKKKDNTAGSERKRHKDHEPEHHEALRKGSKKEKRAVEEEKHDIEETGHTKKGTKREKKEENNNGHQEHDDDKEDKKKKHSEDNINEETNGNTEGSKRKKKKKGEGEHASSSNVVKTRTGHDDAETQESKKAKKKKRRSADDEGLRRKDSTDLIAEEKRRLMKNSKGNVVGGFPIASQGSTVHGSMIARNSAPREKPTTKGK